MSAITKKSKTILLMHCRKCEDKFDIDTMKHLRTEYSKKEIETVSLCDSCYAKLREHVQNFWKKEF